MNQRQGLHKIIRTNDAQGSVLTYRLLGQIYGRGCFAEVSLRKEIIPLAHLITFSGQEFGWLKEAYGPNAREWTDSEDYRQAVMFGIQYALHNCQLIDQPHDISLTVLRIGANSVDTTLDAVAYVAVFATWELLGADPLNEPYIGRHHISFPGRHPELNR